MQFITDFIVALLTAYLAFTNHLAEVIFTSLPSNLQNTEYTTKIANTPSNEPELRLLPSIFDSSKFPDILLRSAEYQSAATINTALPAPSTVTDPREALVNIFCTFTGTSTIRTTTGSGFFVTSSGAILTNAHVAQYLLLGETKLLGEAECIIRQGTPAQPKYRAGLLYIPPTWVQKNAALINAASPTGTGERDYALLYVKEALNGEILPTEFPALTIQTEFLPRTMKNKAVVAAGYPATDLFHKGPNSPLLSVAASTSISELYTFGSNYADVFSIRGSKVGAEGSSGGPVINSNHEVIGMIVTRGDDNTDGPGSLRAISLSHIHRTILEETGFSLERNLSGNLDLRSTVFTNTLAPFLTTILSYEFSN